MASDNEASCVSDPNFAVICSFLERFGKSCGLEPPDIGRLQEMIENSQEVPQELIDLHIKLLRKARKSVAPEKWEKAVIKFCHTYSNQDGWELERIGYKKARIAIKLRLLKTLLETQFDANQKFKNEINKLSATELRLEPLGRDKAGLVYWCQLDEECNIRVYREDVDEENWELIAKTRDEVVALVNTLTDGEIGAIPISEDSNSLETLEKPTIDTGQDENTVNGDEKLDDTANKSVKKSAEEEEEDETDEDDEDEEEDEEEDEDDEQEEEEEEVDDEEEEDNKQESENSKENGKKLDSNVENPVDNTSKTKVDLTNAVEVCKVDKSSKPLVSEITTKKEELLEVISTKNGVTIDIVAEGPKSIETPVITTSPLKLVNIAELKHSPEKKPEILSKVPLLNNLPYGTTIEASSGHSKLPIKPIDQLAANLHRLQSEKLESQKSVSKLEKIAENLAKGQVSVHALASNGEDAKRTHRGMDLSTSPRGWEAGASDLSTGARPVDFSGMDLTRKVSKELTSPSGYNRAMDFTQQQHREMDLSTRKSSSKIQHPNLAAYEQIYDAHALAAMRNVNHGMVADLSKRQMPYSPLPPNAMFQPSRHPKDVIDSLAQHQRLSGYPMLPVRMPGGPIKRPLEEATSEAMLKRMRSEIPVLKGGNPIVQQRHDWRNEVGEAIEEPLMMVQGEGSGSDCDAVNPIFEEEIEEPVMYFYGEGAGAECDTGNPTDKSSTSSTETKSEESGKEELDVKSSKPKIKLGVQVFSPTVSPTKRTSRWDVGAPGEKMNISGEDAVSKSDEDSVSPPKFFFGPNCVAYGANKSKDSAVATKLQFNANEDDKTSVTEQKEEKDTKKICEKMIPIQIDEVKKENESMEVQPSEEIKTEEKVEKETESSECKSEESAENHSNKALLDLQCESETEKKEDPVGDFDGKSLNEISEEENIKKVQTSAENLMESSATPEKESAKDEFLKKLDSASSQKKSDESDKKAKKSDENLELNDQTSTEKAFVGENKIHDDPTVGDFEDELGKTLAAMNEFDEKPEKSETTAAEKLPEKEVSDKDLEMELSKMEEEEGDLESTLANMGEGAEKDQASTQEKIEKIIPESESRKSDQPQELGDDSSMFSEETSQAKEQVDSISNLLSTLEKDEDSEVKSKANSSKNPDPLLSTLDEDVTDFKQGAEPQESDLLSTLEDIVAPQKVDEDSQKTSECDKSNLLSNLQQDEVESSIKMIEDSNLLKNETLKASQKSLKENAAGADSSKLEDSNYFRDFGKGNQSFFGTELDDTVKMEETFSVENTSRLVRLSPERMDESVSSQEVSFRENVNFDSQTTDLPENSASQPMSVSDEQTNEGDFSFPKTDDTQDLESMSNGSEQNKDEILLLPPSASLTVENLKQKNAETQGSITVPEILGIKRLDAGDISEASSLIAECASSIREDEEDGFSVDPTDALMPTTSEAGQNKNEILLPPSASLTVENLKQKNEECLGGITIPEILSIKRLDEDKSEASSLIAECASSIREDEEDALSVDPTDAMITDEKSNDFEEEDEPPVPSLDVSMGEKFTEDKIQDLPRKPEAESTEAKDDLSKTDDPNVNNPEKSSEEKNKIQDEKILNELESNDEEKVPSASKDEKLNSAVDNSSTEKKAKDVKEKADELIEKLSALEDSKESKSENASETGFKSLVPHYDSSSEDDKNFDDLDSENVTSAKSESVAEDLSSIEKEVQVVKTPKVPTEQESDKKEIKLSTDSNEGIELPTEQNDGKEDAKNKTLESEKEKIVDEKVENEIKSSEDSEKVDLSTNADLESKNEENIVDVSAKNKSEINSALLNHEDKESVEVNSSEAIERNSLEASHKESNYSKIINEDIQMKTSKNEENLKSFVEQQESEKLFLESKYNAKLDDQSPITQVSKKRKEETNDFLSKTYFEKQQINEIMPKNKPVSVYQLDTPNNSMMLDANYDNLKYHDKILHSSSGMEINEIKSHDQLENKVQDKLLGASSDHHEKNCVDELKKESVKRSSEEPEDLPPSKYKSLESKENLETLVGNLEESLMETETKVNENLFETKSDLPLEKPVESSEPLTEKVDSSLDKLPEKVPSPKPQVSDSEPLVDKVVEETKLLEQESPTEEIKAETEMDVSSQEKLKAEASSAEEDFLKSEKMQTAEEPEEKMQISDEKPQESMQLSEPEKPEEKMQVTESVPAEKKPDLEDEASDDSVGNDESMFDAPPDDDADPMDDSEPEANESSLPPTEVKPEPATPIKTPADQPVRSTRASRKRRNSAHDSNSEDVTSVTRAQTDEEETTAGKRMKLRGKRQPDLELRKSVEKTRKISVSSEDDTAKALVDASVNEGSQEDNSKDDGQDSASKKNRGRPRGKKRKGGFSKGRPPKKSVEQAGDEAADEAAEESVEPNDVTTDEPQSKAEKLEEKPMEATEPKKKQRKKRTVLGLEIPDTESTTNESETPVRASRRIAQLKIKREAETTHDEEVLETGKKHKKDKSGKHSKHGDESEKKKKKKKKDESEEDAAMMKDLEKESKKKRRKRRKKKLAAFNEAKPWQSSSGSSDTDENEHEEEEEEEEVESDGERLVFKSDHEFSPESDLEKDDESSAPVRHARTAQKPSKSDVEAEVDEYACQKCNKADHPEWILLCDSCDKGWHCSCLRPALMLIPEGDWFCPPCQHNTLVVKLQESLKTLDVMTKKHENEALRKKRLAYVGISLENVLQKGTSSSRKQRESRDSSDDDDDGSSEEGSSSEDESSSEESSSAESDEPVYQLRERRCANTYKFNEYDDMINAAIKDEVEAVRTAGNQGRGKDISTIVNADKEEKAQAEALKEEVQEAEEHHKSEKESDEDYKVEKEEDDEAEEEEDPKAATRRKLLARKKHRKLNSLDVSSEDDDPYSDEDFKGTSSDEEEDPDEQLSSSDDSDMSLGRRRGGRRGDSRAVRRSTRARQTRFDEDFINDDSEDSDRPKKKKSRATWGSESEESEESDNSWKQKKKRRRTSSSRRSFPSKKKESTKKKKKRKRIIAQEDSDEEEEQAQIPYEDTPQETAPPSEEAPQENEPEPVTELIQQIQNPEVPVEQEVPEDVEMSIDESSPMEQDTEPQAMVEAPSVAVIPTPVPIPAMIPTQASTSVPSPAPAPAPGLVEAPTVVETPTIVQTSAPEHVPDYIPAAYQDDGQKKKKKEPKQMKIRRKVIYGRIPDENETAEEDTTLGRRTRGRKISYLDSMPSDSDEELKKALRKTEDTEEEFIFGRTRAELTGIEETEKDSDSDDYAPNSALASKAKSPRGRGKKSPGTKRKSISEDGTPKIRKKPGPKPGSKKGPRMNKSNEDLSAMDAGIINDADMLSGMQVDDSGQGVLPGTVTGEGSLASLNPAELEGLDDEQIDQMMIEDEEYGRRQLELAAIEINKKKKKEEREAKKLEKAKQKALEILEAERLESMNMDGDVPKKKKRGRRSKAEILADQMRRESLGLPPEQPPLPPAPAPQPPIQQALLPPIGGHPLPPQQQPLPAVPPGIIPPPADMIVAPSVVPNIPVMDACDQQRMMENPMMSMMNPGMMEGQPPMFSPDNSPLKPKRRGRGKGKKTLAMEAARAAEAASKDPNSRLSMPPGDMSDDMPGVLPTPGSSTSGSAPSTPPANQPTASVYPGSVPPQAQQSSVITRMLQSQPPVPSSAQSFTQAAAAMGHKYFGGPNVPGQMMPGPRPGYDLQNRGRIPSPYRQGGPQALPPHFASVRPGGLPGSGMRLRVPGPQMYHTPHHPLDPSPSGGGPISINTRDRSSPLGPGPAMIPPSAGSPLAKGGPTPPPPYVRGVGRFGDGSPMNPRHPLPPFSSASPGVVNHAMQQSPTSSRPGGGNFSPYHPPPPPNYHYGAYPPPPPMSTADDAAAYQSSPYSSSAEQHFSSPGSDRGQGQSQQQPPAPTQQQPPPQLQVPGQPPQGAPVVGPHPHGHPGHPGHPQGKYDEEGSGEFGGLVSYFSSQREDDIES